MTGLNLRETIGRGGFLANRLGVPVEGRLLKMAWDACAACNPRGMGAPDDLEARFRPVKPCQQDGTQLLDCAIH